MRNLLLVLAAAVPLAAPVHAQVVAGAAEASAWVGPVAGAFSAAGTDRIAALGSPALTNLSVLGPNQAYAFAGKSEKLGLLAQSLAAAGETPAAFAARPTAEKLSILHAAAQAAQARAEALADAAIAATAQPVRFKTVDRAAAAVEDAAFAADYLPADKASELKKAENAVRSFQKKRSALIESFVRDLPAKLTAGEINAENLIQKDADGWLAADERPDARHGSAYDLYAARLKSLEAARSGPGAVAQYDLLLAALDRPDVAQDLDGQWNLDDHSEIWTERPSSTLRRRLLAGREKAARWTTATPERAAALSRFTAGTPRAKDFKVVEELHEQLVGFRLDGDLTARAHSEAAVIRGAEGLPSRAEYRDARRREENRLNKAAIIAGGMQAVTTAAAAIVSHYIHLSGGTAWLVFGLSMAPIMVFARLIWVRDSLSWNSWSPVDERLSRRG